VPQATDLATMLDTAAAEHHAQTADRLEGLLRRLGRDGLSVEEWNGLLSAVSSERTISWRRRRSAEGHPAADWIIPRPDGPLSCYQCRLPYEGDHWVEAVVPHHVWERISPTGDSGGILCVSCMALRLTELGLRPTLTLITAGPLACVPTEEASEVIYREGHRDGAIDGEGTDETDNWLASVSRRIYHESQSVEVESDD
jgi:hypothetical protein